MLDVGIAGLPLDYPFSGTAVYVRNLVPRLSMIDPDLNLTVYLRDRRATPIGARRQVLRTPFDRLDRSRPAWARLDKFVWETIGLPLTSSMRGEAVLHVPYLAAPPITSARLVVTVHDVIPLTLPGYHRGRASSAYTTFMARTVSRADAIITVSEYSKQDIVRVLGVPASRIHVTYEAADTQVATRRQTNRQVLADRYGISFPYVLYMGGAERRKNVETLVRAWARIVAAVRAREIRLLLVAKFPEPDALYPDIPRLVREIGLAKDVVIVPEVAEEDKALVYEHALAFCFPSLYEGFGLTPLEAMSAGIPVLASDATSIPEVVGDAGILLSPRDVAAWADGIRMLLDSEPERRALAQAGRARARTFTWERTAAQTMQVYRRVVDS